MFGPNQVRLYVGEELARYNFGESHPFGPRRQAAFWDEAQRQGLDIWAQLMTPVQAPQKVLQRFHDHDYVERVRALSRTGGGYLDAGDTPAVPGIYEAAAFVVGSVLHALDGILERRARRAFVPIAGLHHAARGHAAGFCVFNDIGVAIETLRAEYGIRRIAYVDIDAHHGDGVYYAFARDPEVFMVDFHQQGIYPGTGSAGERGVGAAEGTKHHYPMPAGATDRDFLSRWEQAEGLLRAARPELFILQCGADSLAGDPITYLGYSAKTHGHVARRLVEMAEELCDGRVLALGGGGYHLPNIAQAWNAVLRALLGLEEQHPGAPQN